MNFPRAIASSFLLLLTLLHVRGQSRPITDDDWESLDGITSRNVVALPVLNNTLYAVGDGLTGSGISHNLLQWTGTSWSIPGGAPVSPISVHAYYYGSDDAAIYFGSYSVKVGLFGPVYLNYIYSWSGYGWSDTGLGDAFSPAYLSAMQAFGGSYMMAGSFASPIPNLVATTTGAASYQSLGSGVDGPVNLIKVVGTNLYVAGLFAYAGDIPAYHVAVWNGSNWKALGNGFTEAPYSMVASGSDLYLASVDSVSKWDGKSWTLLGSGFSKGSEGGPPYHGIFAMAASGKDLFVGGLFTAAGNTPATNIARWDGTTWSALGSGVEVTHRVAFDFGQAVNALSILGDYLYVGGDLDRAGNKACIGFARVNLAGPKKLLNHPVLVSPRSIGFTFDNGIAGQTYRIQTANSIHPGIWTDYTNFVFTQPTLLTVPTSPDHGATFVRSVSP